VVHSVPRGTIKLKKMKTKISILAAQIRKKRNEVLDEFKLMENLQTEQDLLFLLKDFEASFSNQLPLLIEAGIKWSAHFNDNHFHHKGSFIMFTHNGKELKMDFNGRKSYRYEYIPCTPGRRIGKSVYGEWDKEDFILFIDENLLSV
jgi:hypothetical protein